MPEYLFDHLDELETFKNDDGIAILTDIDGTISEISDTPEGAGVSMSMKRLLSRLNHKFQLVAVISGRSVDNVRSMVDVEGLLYVGNHGMEYMINEIKYISPEAEKYLPDLKRNVEKLENGDLSKITGLMFEDKGVCLAIHYRQCDLHVDVRKKILDEINKSNDSKNLKVSEGRKVVEIKPSISRDKGYVVEKISVKCGPNKIIYLGDDITDLDAFKKLEELEKTGSVKTASILVLSSEIPDYVKNSSLFYVNNVDEVQRFFNWLLE